VGWDFFDLQEYLQGCFGKRVDLVTPGALKPAFKESILREVRYA
jgi:predicted nucleotidyltransferase